jgi:hypothetical protein
VDHLYDIRTTAPILALKTILEELLDASAIPHPNQLLENQKTTLFFNGQI